MAIKQSLMQMYPSNYRFLLPLLAVLATATVSFGVSVFAVEPTTAPPEGNAYTPIHVGASPQSKAGSLRATHLVSVYDAYFGGKFQINSNAPFLKFVESDKGSDSFDFVVDGNTFSIRRNGAWPAPFVLKNNGWIRVGIENSNPIGDLDIEDGSDGSTDGTRGTATLCLNGVCIRDLRTFEHWPPS